VAYQQARLVGRIAGGLSGHLAGGLQPVGLDGEDGVAHRAEVLDQIDFGLEANPLGRHAVVPVAQAVGPHRQHVAPIGDRAVRQRHLDARETGHTAGHRGLDHIDLG
jgi:hypothetical protein